MKENFLEKRKKGQAELFGLIIIVIILIFALLFFVKIRQDDDSSVTLRSNFRANNLMNAIMDVNLDDAEKSSLKELMKNCMDNPTIGDTSSPPNRIRSPVCETADTELDSIFNAALSETENYQFKGSLGDTAHIERARGGCDEGITASPVRLPRNYNFQLKICS